MTKLANKLVYGALAYTALKLFNPESALADQSLEVFNPPPYSKVSIQY